MKITIEFSTNNASWEDDPRREAAHIIYTAHGMLHTQIGYPNPDGRSEKIIDANGNTIGTITLEVE